MCKVSKLCQCRITCQQMPLKYFANLITIVTVQSSESLNQRTNGPVNAHLISGPIRFLNVFTINEHDGHLGHMTCTIYINFVSKFPRRILMKFGLD